jgi:outer membrane protein
MKKLVTVLYSFLFLLFYSITVNAGEDIKIAFVDLQRALINSESGKEAKKKLKQEFEKLKRNLDEAKEEIVKLDELLKKQAMMLTDEIRREKEKELERKYRNIQRMDKDYTYEYQQKEKELTQKIFIQLTEIIRDLGEKKKYTVIFEKKLLLYVSDSLDLTNEIIKMHNQKYPVKKK